MTAWEDLALIRQVHRYLGWEDGLPIMVVIMVCQYYGMEGQLNPMTAPGRVKFSYLFLPLEFSLTEQYQRRLQRGKD